MGHLEPSSIEINEIVKKYWPKEDSGREKNETIPLEKKFITSPAEVNTHTKMQLQDAEVAKKYKEQFKQLCKEFEDVFFKDSTDIGETPLITMDIDTGDSPPICQKPHNLPLKHREWVQKELETLEKAGVIVKSISHWASPIVVVPKKTARAKSAFVTPLDKFEFTRGPFSLTQAPVYFQRLINKVIKGLPFAF